MTNTETHLVKAIQKAIFDLDSNKIWNGTTWKYDPISPEKIQQIKIDLEEALKTHSQCWIVVNGEKIKLPPDKENTFVSFEEILAMTKYNKDRLKSIVYLAPNGSDGSITSGMTVMLTIGMIFSAIPTDNA